MTVYRGLPYDLPVGLHLYSVNYVSGVPVAAAARRRSSATAHRPQAALASDDAADLVRQLEPGELARG